MTKPTPAQAEREQIFADREWWQSAGNVINLELSGWTFRNSALFIDRKTAQSVEMTGAVAERLIALSPPPAVGAEDEAVGWMVEIPSFGKAFFHDEADALAQVAEPGCENSTVHRVYTRPAPAAVDLERDAILASLLHHFGPSGVSKVLGSIDEARQHVLKVRSCLATTADGDAAHD